MFCPGGMSCVAFGSAGVGFGEFTWRRSLFPESPPPPPNIPPIPGIPAGIPGKPLFSVETLIQYLVTGVFDPLSWAKTLPTLIMRTAAQNTRKTLAAIAFVLFPDIFIIILLLYKDPLTE